VKEQVSRVLSAASGGLIAGILYNVVGRNSSDYQIPNCTLCRRLNHFGTGSEIVTLQSIYDHCQASPYGSARVLYMHDKGSFHPGKAKDRFRRSAMKGAFSDQCLNDSFALGCNVCAVRFSPLPHHHFRGNMWVATCEYIKGLVPPLKFEQAMAKLGRAPTSMFGKRA